MATAAAQITGVLILVKLFPNQALQLLGTTEMILSIGLSFGKYF